MKTILIKNRPYVMVNERVKEFRNKYEGFTLETELVSCQNDECIIKAIVKNQNSVIVATGYAQEDKSSSMINKTSYIENCETSAVGRALGFLGIGIDDSIASAEEVNMAIAKQNETFEAEDDEIIGGEYVLQGGKYDGETIQAVYDKDPSYCKFCAINSRSYKIRMNFKKCIEDNGDFVETEV